MGDQRQAPHLRGVVVVGDAGFRADSLPTKHMRGENMKNIGGLKSMGAIKPQGTPGSGSGEYKSKQLQMSGKSCKPSKSATHKQAMIHGPYGGKKPQG